MRPLQNILNLDQYTSLMIEGKDPQAFMACWDDCVSIVIDQIVQDSTTTKETLREKVRNYALNYLAATPETSGIDKDKFIEDLTDEIEDDLKDYSFPQSPQAVLIAHKERGRIPEDPEERFIKLSP